MKDRLVDDAFVVCFLAMLVLPVLLSFEANNFRAQRARRVRPTLSFAIKATNGTKRLTALSIDAMANSSL